MKKTLRSWLSVILAAMMLLPLLISCGEGPEAATTTTQSVQAPVTEITTEPKLKADIPEDADFKQHVFNFLITGNTENNWKKNDIKADELTGEPLNDAIYQRNSTIEEKLNIKITYFEDHHTGNQNGTGNGYQRITRAVSAGDYDYDAAFVSAYDCGNLAKKGQLLDLYELPYIDLSKPWWDQKANEDMTLAGKMYYTTGDISTADNDATYAILFNKDIVRDNHLDDPYTKVRDGIWTIDAMVEMAADVPADLNSDGKYDDQDRFGAIVWQDSSMGIINCSGVKCCTPNPDTNELDLTLYSERTVNCFQKFTDFFFREDMAYVYQRVSYDLTTPVNMFSSNQSLYFFQLLDLVSYFRDTTVDFGILPYPKYDESQDRYYQTIGSWHSVFLCVPTIQEDAERTGIVLEAMAAESLDTVTPAYYEKTLVGKYIRDEESEDMLTIILASRVYDLGWFYGIGGFTETLNGMIRGGYADLTSRYKQTSKIAEKTLKDLNVALSSVQN